MRFYLAAQISNLRKRFYDNFATRSNTSGSLGTATDGSRWKAINGVIQIVSGKAKSTTVPSSNASGSSYPMAVIDMPTTDNTIEITDTLQGSSAALWVQSSTDWWLVDIDSTFNTIPGNSVYGIVGSNYGATGSNYGDTGDNYGIVGYITGDTGDNFSSYYNYQTNTFSYTTSFTGTNMEFSSSTSYDTNVTTGNFRSASGGNYFVNYVITGYNSFVSYNTGFVTNTSYASGANYATEPGNQVFYKSGDNFGIIGQNYGPVGDNYGVVGSNYGAIGSNYGVVSTNATTYAYAQYLRIKQSSAGIVNTITSALISASQTANSLRIQLSGNQITAKAYSDSSMVSQIGSDLVYTATGATVTTTFGIAISPSSYNQSDEVGSSVNITRS